MGDTIVLWRAWTLYEPRYAARLLLAVCFLLSFGVLLSIICGDLQNINEYQLVQ